MRRGPGIVDLLCLLLAAPLLLLHATLELDTWWHLAQGRAHLRDWPRVPAVEAFSWTAPGTPLASHSWLFDLLLALLERAGGLPLVEVAVVALAAVTLRLVFDAARKLGASGLLAAGAVVLFALLATDLLAARPQLVTYAAFVWLFGAYVDLRAGRDRLWLAPPVLLVWSNLHGGVVLGVAFLLGVAGLEAIEHRRGDLAAGERVRRLALYGLVGAAATCVTPSGPAQLAHALSNTPLRLDVATLVNEWQPPDLDRIPALRVTLGLSVLAALALPAAPPLFEGLGLLAGLALGLSAWRHVPLLGLTGAPILAAWLTRAARRHAPALRARRAALAAAIERLDGQVGRTGPRGWALLLAAALAAAALVVARPPDLLAAPLVRRRVPVEAVAWARGRGDLRGRLFNSYGWGGYLTWALPAHPVSIDGRMVPFREFLPDHLRASAAEPGWDEVLERHDVRWVLTETSGRLARALRADGRWRLAYEDDVACVFVRR